MNHMPVCTRRGSIVGGSERRVTLVSEDNQSLSVFLGVPDADDECPLTLDPISQDSLSFLGDVSCSKLKSFYKHVPALRKMTMPCGHSFGALNLIYHFARNTMCCPCCRNGVRGKLQASSLPLHLRGPIQNRTQRERRAQILEEQEEDRLVAEALSDSTQAVIQPTVYPTLGLRSILHSDVTARLALYASEEGNEGERQPLSVANLKPLVYDSLYGLIVLQTDYFDCPLTGDVEITVTASGENDSPVVSATLGFPVEPTQSGENILHYTGAISSGYLRLIPGSRGLFQIVDCSSTRPGGRERTKRMQVAWYVEVETIIRMHPGCVEILGVGV